MCPDHDISEYDPKTGSLTMRLKKVLKRRLVDVGAKVILFFLSQQTTYEKIHILEVNMDIFICQLLHQSKVKSVNIYLKTLLPWYQKYAFYM